jgi:hypothetical protein
MADLGLIDIILHRHITVIEKIDFIAMKQKNWAFRLLRRLPFQNNCHNRKWPNLRRSCVAERAGIAGQL